MPPKPRIITTIPVCDGEAFILQTLESLARQRLLPDRVIVIDNCSRDRTEEIVKSFEPIRCEWTRNPANLGLFGNFNRCLDYADQGEYLHILHADDLVEPEFYEVMSGVLADCAGFGLAWCLDERIDEFSRRLSISGEPDGQIEVLEKDEFLKRKAEIGNQAFAATLMKTCGKPAPCRFPMDMPILGDMVFWPRFGTYCQKLVHVHRLLAKYRWHGSNATNAAAPSLNALVGDEWRTINEVEGLRGEPGGLIRWAKLKGLMAVRAGIKAKRYRQLGNEAYSEQITSLARSYTGLPLWLAGQALVELRELLVFKLGRRPRHPKNIFS